MSFTLLGEKITLKTPRSYPRPPEDALWLAAAFTPAPGASVLDAACGIGTIALALASRCPKLQITGVELNLPIATAARANIKLNNKNITISCDNILNHNPNSKYDAIFCNPPFHEEARGHESPSEIQIERHTMPKALLEDWLTHFSKIITPTGTIALVLHSHQQNPVIKLATKLGLGGTIHPLKTAEVRPPKRIIALLTPQTSGMTLCDITNLYEETLRTIVLQNAEALNLSTTGTKIANT